MSTVVGGADRTGSCSFGNGGSCDDGKGRGGKEAGMNQPGDSGGGVVAHPLRLLVMLYYINEGLRSKP
ncbi:hypothetical protein NSU_4380 [Novosphingobium pentaromativorans US6-1]|uniref:Uncharacterized protein n=1 Tax=Novosphingobium pentaromativorans US6-1 TaxID=1088721 RepID=G6EJ59_9SPHN|nr:hypothetical protein NSU_4380 [Novosphingobium pentaromativorans US6-1]